MKVVLATSSGIDDNGNYIIYSPSRWCEGIKSKSRWFAYYPWELGYLSSLLKKDTDFEVNLIDGCLERLNKRQYYERILEQKPDWLLFESSTRTIDESLWIAKNVKNKLRTKLIFAGQHPSVYPKDLLRQGVDYVCIGEYEFTVLELLQGKNPLEILGLYPNKRRDLLNINQLPFPEDKDVKRIDYAYPGEPCAEYREIELFASRGCPFNCNFCVARNVYYNKSNWRSRNVNNIVSEIMYLKDKYIRMEGIFFNEEVHNGKKSFILDLSKRIINNKLDKLSYEAMCDVRLLDKESVYAMSKAGYYKIRVGIESASQRVLKSINKNIDLEELKEKLFLCKSHNIKTYGTFMFGAPGSSIDRDKKTIKFIQQLIQKKLLDNVQISVSVPQPGTPFYKFAMKNKYLKSQNYFEFDGGLNSVVNYPGYSADNIIYIKNLALKVRDKESWHVRIKSRGFLKWVKKLYYKYGFKIFFHKINFKTTSLFRKFVKF